MPLVETARQRVAGDVENCRFDWALHQIEANHLTPDATRPAPEAAVAR